MDTHQYTIQQALSERTLLENALLHIEQRIDNHENVLKVISDAMETSVDDDSAWDMQSPLSLTFEDQLAQTAKLATIGELLGGIAHEINNPLQILLGHVQLLQFGKDIPRRTEIIREQIGRIVQITKRLVEFSRSTPGNLVLEPLCINTAVEQILPLLAYQFRSNEIEVELHLDPSVPAIRGSIVHLQQVFLNLFINAREAIGRKGKMTVETIPGDGTVTVRVTDTGCGMPPENLERVFEPFFTTKSDGKGTGLGLYVSYSIIKKHNGTISVTSEKGAGSTFTIVLPAG